MKVERIQDVEIALKKLSGKCVLKKAHLGYDGKGTFILKDGLHSASDLLKSLEWPFNGYAEEYAKFKCEFAVVLARSKVGKVVSYPVIETFQRNSKCDWTVVPAQVPPRIQRRAQKIASDVIKGFGGTGVFGVEMFWMEDDRVIVNEIAPRVHNSGHVTMNSFDVSQFELHLRAALGMKLKKPEMIVKAAAMVNLLGEKDLIIRADFQTELKVKASSLENAWIHWYGKLGQGLGRKLGHINTTSAVSVKAALISAKKIRRGILI